MASTSIWRNALGIAVFAWVLSYCVGQARRSARADDVLPSWNDGPSRRAILAFLAAVTDRRAPTFVEPSRRIAVFDNDGTLWAEQPLYIQLQFAIDRVQALAAQHPEWRAQEPFKAILAGDRQLLARMSQHDVAKLIAATHAGITTDAFDRAARRWFESAMHPRFGRLYRECVYQPMLELLALLRANGFRTFVVSGGGVDFMRAVAEDVYRVPPAQVIGSSGKTHFEIRDGRPVLTKLPEVSSIDDAQGKPINIHLHVGQRPILAFGNSDGDLQMLQYAAFGEQPHLALLLHHDDARREYAYDRHSPIGRLDRALDVAAKRGWTVVSMKTDWSRVFPRAPGAGRMLELR